MATCVIEERVVIDVSMPILHYFQRRCLRSKSSVRSIRLNALCSLVDSKRLLGGHFQELLLK